MSVDYKNGDGMDFLDDSFVWDELRCCEEPLDGDFGLREESLNTSLKSSNERDVGLAPGLNEELLKKYPRHLETGINAHSLHILRQSLRKFATEDFTSIYYYPKGNPHSHSYRECRGLNITADFMHKVFSSVPDSIFLVHDTQISHDADGTIVIHAKFTCNGTRLRVITSHVDGIEHPDAPSVIALFNNLQMTQINTNIDDYDEFCESADASRKPITLKKDKEFKSNESTNYSTGAHIEYASFSESSLKNNKKKRSDMENSNDQCDDIKYKVNSGENNEKEISVTAETDKNNAQFQASYAQNTDNMNNMSKEQAFITKLSTQISSKFSADEIMIADNRTSFGFSALLRAPVSYDIYGVMKFYINAKGKVFCMEVPLAAKAAKK